MLYAITDTTLTPGNTLFTAVDSVLAGGCRWLQYRDKSTDRAKRFEQAQKLKSLCDNYSAKLIINDDVDLAIEIGADGVHLGQGDGSLSEARQRLGQAAIIGSTCHNDLSLARTAVAEGASYVAFGRLFNSSTKPQASQAEFAIFEQAKALGVPTVGIGGITLDNASQVIAAGASMIAVCHSVFACDDIKSRTQRFCDQCM